MPDPWHLSARRAFADPRYASEAWRERGESEASVSRRQVRLRKAGRAKEDREAGGGKVDNSLGD